MIYKRNQFGAIMKIDPSYAEWRWADDRTSSWYRSTNFHEVAGDCPSCLLECILLRPDLDYT
jgi:hypothetical protein